MSEFERPVARLHAGELVGDEPRMCDGWRFTTDDRDVAAAIYNLTGGTGQQVGAKYEVKTSLTELEVELVSVTREFQKWAEGVLLSRCDGNVKADGGGACCTAGLSDEERMPVLRALSETAMGGCQPSTRVLFKLVNAPELGVIEFRSGGKGIFAGTATLVDAVGARVRLAIESFTSKKGFSWKAPTVALLAPAPVSVPAALVTPFVEFDKCDELGNPF